MVTKKEKIAIAVLAVGGFAAAISILGKEEPIPGGVLGGAASPGYDVYIPEDTPTIWPTPGGVVFPEPVDYSAFLKDFFVAPTAAPQPVGTSKKEIIYGGYTPSGKTYVFGGPAFEAQAATEVSELGYS
ncbi:unnamed protein product, partial [marine sediment metagenome]